MDEKKRLAILAEAEAIVPQTDEAHRSLCCGFLDPKGVTMVDVTRWGIEDPDKVEMQVKATTIPDGTIMACGGCGELVMYMGGRRVRPTQEAIDALDMVGYAMVTACQRITKEMVAKYPPPKEWYRKEA